MKLLFKQRLFSWFDSYDIYDEAGNTAFVVKGELAWGHLLRIYNSWEKRSDTLRKRCLPGFRSLRCMSTLVMSAASAKSSHS